MTVSLNGREKGRRANGNLLSSVATLGLFRWSLLPIIKSHGVSMKQESSKKSKTVVSDKFYDGKRHICFPQELFIELRLSKRQILKVRGWEKDHHSVMPMWFTNCERVLFLDQERFEEWLLEEGKR